MKFIKDLLKRKPKPDPTKPETMQPEAPAAPREEKAVEKGPGMFARVKERFFGGKEETAAPKEEGLSALEAARQKLAGLVDKKNGKHARNVVLIVAGGGLIVAGVAADVMLLGGMGTATVAGMIYSDFRNKQHIEKISNEISKIDSKIDELKHAKQAVPEYGPALAAVKSSIEDFQASAKKVPPEVAEELERLKKQVGVLQDKIAPAANDDAKPAKPAASGP